MQRIKATSSTSRSNGSSAETAALRSLISGLGVTSSKDDSGRRRSRSPTVEVAVTVPADASSSTGDSKIDGERQQRGQRTRAERHVNGGHRATENGGI